MNNKKEIILNNNIYNFVSAFNSLNNAYTFNNELNIYKYICILEREATRLFTHFEDWTTNTNELTYKEYINKRMLNQIKDINSNLKAFIQEQQQIDRMMYYTYMLLHSARIL